MEQVEYPGMSGTNTICTVTALLETGMLPMTEPVTEVVARGTGRADPRPCRVPGRQGHQRHLPERAGLRRLPGHAHRGAAAGHGRGRRRLWRHVLRHRLAEAFGLRLTPGRGTRHHPHLGDDQGRGPRAAAGRPSGAAGFAGHHHRRSSRGRRTPRGLHAPQRGHRLDRRARLGRGPRPGPGPSTARRAAPARAPRWPSSTPRASWASARRSSTRASWARRSPDDSSRRRRRCGERRGGGRAGAHRHGLDHGFASWVLDPTDPFPEGFTVGDIW